jgi:hypothetical protein
LISRNDDPNRTTKDAIGGATVVTPLLVSLLVFLALRNPAALAAPAKAKIRHGTGKIMHPWRLFG